LSLNKVTGGQLVTVSLVPGTVNSSVPLNVPPGVAFKFGAPPPLVTGEVLLVTGEVFSKLRQHIFNQINLLSCPYFVERKELEVDSELYVLASFLSLFFSFFLGWLSPNLITKQDGW